MHFHMLPNELLQNIAFLIAAHDPLGPPAQLIPLLSVSKHFYAALWSPKAALKARLFRLKFDTSAVSRRAFSPYDIHLSDQLEFYCRVLQIVKSGDVYHKDVANLLFAAYVMMLDNDGKNFAQLECAGIAPFVSRFIRLRLWDDRSAEGNAGWPVASQVNRCALWLAWLTMDKIELFKEPPQARDDFISLIFPCTLLSTRYPATEAPPNHFHLPLLPGSPAYQRPLISSNPPFPPYPHYSPHPVVLHRYFGSTLPISPPLMSIAAKLLFTARKEIFPIGIPPVFPPGLGAQDYIEFNKAKAAQVVRGARWDWNRGCAVAVNPKKLRSAFVPRSGHEFSELEQSLRNELELIADGDEESRRWDEEWWRRILCDNVKTPRPKFPPSLVYKPGTLKGTWQGRLYMPSAEALHAAIEVYPFYPGYPTNQEPPGNTIPTFSEASTSLVMLPVFFNLQEHHRICHCPVRGTDQVHQPACGAVPVPTPSLYPPPFMRWRGMRPHMVVVPPEEVEPEAVDPAPNSLPEGETLVPPTESADLPGAAEPDSQVPLVFGVPADEVGLVEDDPADPALNENLTANTELGNPNTNNLAYGSIAPAPPLPPNVNLASNNADAQPAIQTALPAPDHPQTHATEAGHTGAHGQGQPHPAGTQDQQNPPDFMTFLSQQLGRQNDPRMPRLIPTAVDYSMNNAYFPGDIVPSLMFVKRRGAAIGNSGFGGKRRRDEIVFGFRELSMGNLANQTGQVGWKTFDGRCISDKGEMNEEPSRKEKQLYVYETYDSERESAHDPSVCKTCKEWEDVRKDEKRRQEEVCERRLERRVEKEERRRRKGKQVETAATRMLEEYMQDYGRRAGASTDGVSSTDFQSLNPKFGKGLLDAVTMAAAKETATNPISHSGAMSETSDSEYESDFLSDDDLSTSRDGVPSPRRRARRADPPTRRIFDRARNGMPEGCGGGVKDIIITGETPRRHIAWHRQKYALYGRVRSWDGMIGLLRVDERSMPGYSTGMQNLGANLEESEYWSVITNMFICGYVVGGSTFVGEWRMAAGDPLKPGWSGAILMSLREEEDGEEPVWEAVGGEAT